ncbi:MAG: hypothetical protein HY207_10395 [Nitrospirae bacterium]|nr:hypothetical protein [Nitrospirota bacterium]
MGFLFRTAVFTGFLALAFAAGYWLGAHRLDVVSDHVKALKNELADKTASLDREMTALKRRAALAEARDAVDRARQALSSKQIGDAEQELTLAAERLQAAAADATADAKTALGSLRKTLVDLRRDVRSVPSRAQDELRRMARRIDELARQWD